ncbi:MAG TPA: ATP-binding protein [Candidatus Polarisedimenticolia bacterium]|nr:ATP-binding protein [Candidatus Polarisedimenticolia bacterium]
MSGKRQPENPYRFLANEILRIAPCDRIAFAVPAPEIAAFRLVGAYPEWNSFPETVIPVAGSCVSLVISQRHAQLLSAIGEESHYAEEEMLYKVGVRDAAFVPLFYAGELMAVAIVGRHEVNSLESRSVRCIERVSGLLAAVLAAAREASGGAVLPEAVVSGSAKIPQAEDVERACRGLMEAIRHHTPYRRAVLTLLDQDYQGFQWFFSGFDEEEIDTFHSVAPGKELVRGLFGENGKAASQHQENGNVYIPLTGSRAKALGYLTLRQAEGEAEIPSFHLSAVRMMASTAAVTLERNLLQRELCLEQNRLKKAQEQLVHSDRLSALGQMVGGVAHELNNPLSGVIGFAELALKNNASPRIDKDLQRIVREAHRCQHIVKDLLIFARRTKPERKAIDINELVENVLDLRANQLRDDNVKVQTDLAKALPPTLGVNHQIQQVLLNIINNAHQAMLEVPGKRTLRVRTLTEGSRILIRVSDSGPGIAPSALERVFEPFYTTKSSGKGTGLGLSLSQGLIKDHGGQIAVESLVGRGTTFTVKIPILEVPDEPKEEKQVAPSKVHETPRNILVVDDEEVIVDLLNEVLSTAGHKVETARDGRQALDKILSEGYDAVITDLKMPGLDGSGLYENVCREKPEMANRFVFSTGDASSTTTQAFFKKTGCPCLVKPFDLQAVRETLDQIFSHR